MGWSLSEVSFVNGIATNNDGTHVDYITNQITNYVMGIVNKKNKNANVKAHTVKNHLCVFVIDNPRLWQFALAVLGQSVNSHKSS